MSYELPQRGQLKRIGSGSFSLKSGMVGIKARPGLGWDGLNIRESLITLLIMSSIGSAKFNIVVYFFLC